MDPLPQNAHFSWLDSVSKSPDSRGDALAPPPVSFGGASTPDIVKLHESHGSVFTSADHLPEPSVNSSLTDLESIPLSLTAQDLSLEELKTYMRWYSDILARTNRRTITLADVYQFLGNFRLLPSIKESISAVFMKLKYLVNIGEFFAILRVVAHTLNGHKPARHLIREKTSVPVPPLILSKKRMNEESEELHKPAPELAEPAAPLDLDLFTQFMLTGERPGEQKKKRSKKAKSVKFSDQIVTDVHVELPDSSVDTPIDYLLPMNQLLEKIQALGSAPQQNGLLQFLSLPGNRAPPHPSSPDPEERQILEDMAQDMNHFRNLNSVDTMLIGGVPANIHVAHGEFLLPRPLLPAMLQPNMTGPAQMRQMEFSGHHGDNVNSALPAPLRPNITGPADMARLFSPPPNAEPPRISLQLFSDQFTAETADNTAANGALLLLLQDKQLPPPPVPATRRVRSLLTPNSVQFLPNGEIMRTSGTSTPPLPPKSPLGSSRLPPPPPPPSRRRGNSTASPSPVPAYAPSLAGFYENSEASSSTANILDDLKALQEEVDKIRHMTGGF